MMQARMSEGDRRLYNPNRDVAHNFSAVVGQLMERYEQRRWPALMELLQLQGVEFTDVDQALNCFVQFMVAGKDEPEVPMADLLEKHGFTGCKPGAQIAIMALLGTIYSGMQFAGVREATIDTDGPLFTVDRLVEQGAEFQKALGAIPAKRVPLSPWAELKAAMYRFVFSR